MKRYQSLEEQGRAYRKKHAIKDVTDIKAGDTIEDKETGKRKKVRSVIGSLIHTTDDDMYDRHEVILRKAAVKKKPPQKAGFVSELKNLLFD